LSTNSELFLQIYNLGGHNYLLDRIFIFGANELIFVTFIIIFLLIILGGPQERRAFLLIIVGLILAKLLVIFTHIIFFEPRPYITFNLIPLISHTPDAAFPSTHTTVMATVAAAYLFCKSKFSLLFLFLMFWVGFARIYVGVHYPLDILGGIIYGLFAILLTILLNKKIKFF